MCPKVRNNSEIDNITNWNFFLQCSFAPFGSWFYKTKVDLSNKLNLKFSSYNLEYFIDHPSWNVGDTHLYLGNQEVRLLM